MKPKKPRKLTDAQIAARNRLRYHKVLTTTLNESCAQYTWYGKVAGALRARDYPALYQWADSVTTVVYDDAAEHFAANQISALIRKYPWVYTEIGLPTDPEQAAFSTFIAAELRCRRSNRRLKNSRVIRSRYSKYIVYMRRWISRVLGESPPLREIYDKCGFSSGSAIGVHGNATNLYRKIFAEDWTVSRGARTYALHALWSNDQILASFMDQKNGIVCHDVELARSRMREKVMVVPFNKVSFVAKTAKTHRSIAVEPLLNSFVQKGIDTYLRQLLLGWGYDLTDQGRNSYLAYLGSVTGHLATMDLSSASDSISIELCRLVLPPDWFEFLDLTRSPSYTYRGKTRRFEKFVTMGNGFCFPLQTLLYAAATRAAIHFTGSERTHSVYGDDIIVPTDAYPLLKDLLAFLGFSVNKQKSFASGPFRESCGADWHTGQDVRPVFLDYHLAGETQLMIFHNATLRSERAAKFFEAVRPLVREWVPQERRFMRPMMKSHKDPVDTKPLDFLRGGLLDPSNFRRGNTKVYTKSWHKLDYYELAALNGAFDVPLDVFMASRFAKWSNDDQRWSWEERVCLPVPDKLDKDHTEVDVANFHRASYLAFLSGSQGGALNLRRKAKLAISQR